MKSMVALIKREYLEHRGAFLYAPAGILVVLTLAMFSALSTGKVRLPFEIGVPSLLKFFEVGFLGMAAIWFAYLLVALFFYFADAFSADRRNNAMFFWKSMPVSDFQVLSSKMLAGLTLFPALIFVALLATVLVLYGLTGYATIALPRLVVPSPLEVIGSTWQIALFSLTFLALAVLWYAPFFAWVGALSTVFRRWSIPLAFLIPGLAGLIENLFLADSGPRAGYVLSYLRERLNFAPQAPDVARAFFSDDTIDGLAMVSRFVAGVDWAQLVGGLIFAALAVYAASEYRRRVIST